MLIPVIAEATIPTWNWTFQDFIFAYVVLVTAGWLVETFAAVVKHARARIGFGLSIGFTFFAIWAWAAA